MRLYIVKNLLNERLLRRQNDKDWEKIFTNYVSDKELESGFYKEAEDSALQNKQSN